MSTWRSNPAAREWTGGVVHEGARAFHRTLPGYAPTPLVDLPALAAELGVARVLVKDESQRLELAAFKVLGASWACHQVLDRTPGAQLVTATDGNHGRAVAWLARLLGTSSTVFVPAVMTAGAEQRIVDQGAEVVRVDADYDETVRVAARYAAEDPRRELVQDTAWPGYEDVPGWIVDGYDTLLLEIDEQLGGEPDLVAVGVGVESLIQAVVAHYRRGSSVRVLSVEPDTAACVLASLEAGAPVSVETGSTVMAGLNCGTVSTLAWPVLRDGCDAAVTVTDEAALAASRDLAALGISSGPSGSSTLAGVRAALLDPGRRAELDLPEDATIVLLSTEGMPA